MHAHWYNLPGFLTPKECLKLIKHAKRYYQPQAGVVGHGAAARKDQMRSTTIRWLDFIDLDLLWLFRRIEKFVLISNRECFGYHLQPSFTEIQFTEYHGESQDHYDWHEDNSAAMKKPMDRKLSFVLQLSDPKDYTGGKFELTPQADPLPAGAFSKQGDALLFRSGLKHRVEPVTSGIRYSLVTWVHGPRA